MLVHAAIYFAALAAATTITVPVGLGLLAVVSVDAALIGHMRQLDYLLAGITVIATIAVHAFEGRWTAAERVGMTPLRRAYKNSAQSTGARPAATEAFAISAAPVAAALIVMFLVSLATPPAPAEPQQPLPGIGLPPTGSAPARTSPSASPSASPSVSPSPSSSPTPPSPPSVGGSPTPSGP